MQRAIFVTEIGKPLSLGTRAIPSPPKGFVQIKISVTQLLPSDTYGRDYGLFIGEKLPFVPGANIAGTVTALGPDSSSKYKIGDEIFGLGSPFHPTPDLSGLQEYALLDVSASAKIPTGFTAEQVVPFPVNSVTSFEALFHPLTWFRFPRSAARPRRPQFRLHQAEYPRNRWWLKCGQAWHSVRKAENEASLKALGATHVVDRHLEPKAIVKAVHGIMGVEGVTHIYDCVSWEYSLAIALVPKAHPSVILTLHPPDGAIELAKKHGLEGTVKVGFIVASSSYLAPLSEGFWKALPGWIEAGKLAVPNYRVVNGFNLEAVEEGLDSYKDGSPVTPLVVKISSLAQ